MNKPWSSPDSDPMADIRAAMGLYMRTDYVSFDESLNMRIRSTTKYIVWLTNREPTRLENLCFFLHMNRAETYIRVRQYRKFQTNQRMSI